VVSNISSISPQIKGEFHPQIARAHSNCHFFRLPVPLVRDDVETGDRGGVLIGDVMEGGDVEVRDVAAWGGWCWSQPAGGGAAAPGVVLVVAPQVAPCCPCSPELSSSDPSSAALAGAGWLEVVVRAGYVEAVSVAITEEVHEGPEKETCSRESQGKLSWIQKEKNCFPTGSPIYLKRILEICRGIFLIIKKTVLVTTNITPSHPIGDALRLSPTEPTQISPFGSRHSK